jgi:septal ring factor EnvC (AmiA/AmiB activator)
MVRAMLRTCALACLVALAALPACRSAYYGALERVGIQKRHILADRIEDGREAQQDAQEQFQDAFERFKTATRFEGGKLEETYRGLASELEDSEARAAEVRERIASIEQVAGDLFDEWEEEISQISRADLRSKSSARLRETRARYAKLLAAMKRAERKMEPVLVAFRDQVLFLKHNLNASAIASLETQATGIQSDVDALVRDLESSIREADVFLSTLEQG